MADSGSDNPILDMGLLGMMQPNPYLDPTLNYNADGSPKPLKLPDFYTGQSAGNMGPTDASGKVIPGFTQNNDRLQADYQSRLAAYNAAQPLAGTTSLNSPGGGSTGQNFQNGVYSPNYLSSLPQGTQSALQSGQSVPLASLGNGSDAQGLGMLLGMPSSDFAMPGQQQAPAAAQPPAPPDLRQTYLDALAAPQGIGNKMPQVGANVPASQPLGVPSVLNAFMAAHPSGGAKGAGAYDNSGFFSTLSNLRNA